MNVLYSSRDQNIIWLTFITTLQMKGDEDPGVWPALLWLLVSMLTFFWTVMLSRFIQSTILYPVGIISLITMGVIMFKLNRGDYISKEL